MIFCLTFEKTPFIYLIHIGFSVKNPGKWVVLDVLFLEDG